MKIIFVAGSWGSGTTALAGALSILGVPTFGPHLTLDDPRTPNTFELLPFRDVVLKYVDERNIELRAGGEKELVEDLKRFAEALDDGEFGPWPVALPKRALLKYPLAMICLPQIIEAFDVSIVVVHRPFGEIEATRKRRSWREYTGAAGAQKMYSKAIGDLMRLKTSYLALSYEDLKIDALGALTKAIDFCGLEDLKPNLMRASEFIRSDDAPSADAPRQKT